MFGITVLLLLVFESTIVVLLIRSRMAAEVDLEIHGIEGEGPMCTTVIMDCYFGMKPTWGCISDA